MAGWFDFVNGQTLPASRVQDYLMDQSVMVFADAAARTAALPSPTNGMLTYLTSPGELYVRTSTAWRTVVDSVNQASVLPTRRNAIINGAFDFWQRGTSFTGYVYTADRWQTGWDITPTSATWSQQTFTPGTAPAAGNEGQFFLRMTTATVGSNTNITISNKVEDVRTLAGQTVTLSFWAKSDSSRTMIAYLGQTFGSGGSSAVFSSPINTTVGSTWTRYSGTVNLGSMSGKTIGAGSFLEVQIRLNTANGASLDIWGVQLEAGSVATPFVRAGGTLQGELAACQRYYYRQTSPTAAYNVFANGSASSTTQVLYTMKMPTTMRVTPTALDFSTLAASDGPGLIAISSLLIANGTPDTVLLAAGLTSATQYRPYTLLANNSASAFVGLSAEL